MTTARTEEVPSNKMPFVGFPKIARFSRDITITEKIDGTNGQVHVRMAGDGPPYELGVDSAIQVDGLETYVRAGSKSRWLPVGGKDDNHGFGRWVCANARDLGGLGPGQHFGEWWGEGIQRGYGLDHKTFSLFNTHRWNDWDARPKCCDVVPVMYEGPFNQDQINHAIETLRREGSRAASRFMKPEGVIIYHRAANLCFKKTIEKDDERKDQREAA